MFAFNEHPQRESLEKEIHARPSHFLKPPVQVSHLAVLSGEYGMQGDHDHASALCRAFGAAPPKAGANYFSGNLGDFHFKWERHAEFSTYTFYKEQAFEQPFRKPAIGLVPADWLKAMPGEVLAAIHIAVEHQGAPARDYNDLAAFFAGHAFAGGSVMGGKARMWTAFRNGEDGFTTLLVRDEGLNEQQLGRLVQYLLEIGSYRLMAMLAFPLAHEARLKIAAIDDELSEIIAQLATSEGVEEERNLLRRLSVLASGIDTVSASTNFRFSAARAYYGLVKSRVEEMREGRIEGLQPPGKFLFHRLAPAMDTCESVTTRLDELSQRITHANDLLRTRVDLVLEEQNRDLLKSMDRRAKLQMRLQETVKGLSIFAVTYYLLNMTYHLAKSAKAMGVAVEPDIAVGMAFPLIAFAVWMGVLWLQRVRSVISKADNSED